MKTNYHLRLSAMGAAALLAAIALPAAATNSGGGLSAYEPGLFYGSISESGISYAAPAATNHVLGAEMVYKSPWGSNITYAYWGEIYLDGSDYRFSSRIDDAFSLSIAGRTLTGGASVKYLDLTGLAAGWYPFEYRVYNGGGGYGGWAGYVKNNLTATHTSASYTTFSKLLDPGDMSLFRCRYTEKDRMLVLSGIDQEIGFVDPPYGATGNLAAGQTLVCTASNLVADAAGYAGVCTGHVVYAKSGDVRTVLHFHPALAPVKIGVLPLSKKLGDGAMKVWELLARQWNCEYDDRGNIGKRYRRQDEIGTPFCVTYDFESETDGAVTVRDRDTMAQERVKIEDLPAYFAKKMEF